MRDYEIHIVAVVNAQLRDKRYMLAVISVCVYITRVVYRPIPPARMCDRDKWGPVGLAKGLCDFLHRSLFRDFRSPWYPVSGLWFFGEQD